MALIQRDAAAAHFNNGETYEPEYPDSQASLEDLCRSHLVSVVCRFLATLYLTDIAGSLIVPLLVLLFCHPPFFVGMYSKFTFFTF